jgi:hypothetical protein
VDRGNELAARFAGVANSLWVFRYYDFERRELPYYGGSWRASRRSGDRRGAREHHRALDGGYARWAPARVRSARYPRAR